MTPAMKSALKDLGMTSQEFATLTKSDPVTVSYWGRVRPDARRQAMEPTPTPAWVGLLLDAWEMCPEAVKRARTHAAAKTGADIGK